MELSRRAKMSIICKVIIPINRQKLSELNDKTINLLEFEIKVKKAFIGDSNYMETQ